MHLYIPSRIAIQNNYIPVMYKSHLVFRRLLTRHRLELFFKHLPLPKIYFRKRIIYGQHFRMPLVFRPQHILLVQINGLRQGQPPGIGNPVFQTSPTVPAIPSCNDISHHGSCIHSAQPSHSHTLRVIVNIPDQTVTRRKINSRVSRPFQKLRSHEVGIQPPSPWFQITNRKWHFKIFLGCV